LATISRERTVKNMSQRSVLHASHALYRRLCETAAAGDVF